jgi:hypothetical protein
MHPFASLKQAWRSFADERPGQRFMQHHRRARQQRSTFKRVLRIGLGAALTAGGIVFWFLPGPGSLLVLFGMAMFAGESRPLAHFMDRAELFIRAQLSKRRSMKDAAAAQPKE